MEIRSRGPSRSSAMPARGVAAHRGGPLDRPENTCAAFEAAVSQGVHQIELDVRSTLDGEIVVMHDRSVDRTTDGTGLVSELTLAEVRGLDASAGLVAFAGERVPTLREAFDCIPGDVWVNVQVKHGEPIAAKVAHCIVEAGRRDGVILACGNRAAAEARTVDPEIPICNLVRQPTRAEYVEHAIAVGSRFVQFHHLRGPAEPDLVARAHEHGIRVNHFCRPEPTDSELEDLFGVGVDFVLVDNLVQGLACARACGIEPLARTVCSKP